MQSVVGDLRKFVAEHSHVEPASGYVRLLRFGTASLDLDVSAYVLAADWNHFLKMQGDLLVSVRDIVQATGAQLAFQPSVYVVGSSSLPADQQVFSTPRKG